MRLALNPFVLAMLLGAAFSGFGLTVRTPFAEIVKLLADAAGPCALFAIGVSLVRPDAPLRSPILALPVSAKLFLHPLLAAAAMTLARGDNGTINLDGGGHAHALDSHRAFRSRCHRGR